MFPQYTKLFLLLYLFFTFQNFANSGEPGFPRPGSDSQKPSLAKPESKSPTLLSAENVITSVDTNGERWRASVTEPEAGELQLIFTMGKGNSAENTRLAKMWASYSYDWATHIASGRTVIFRYTIGQSTKGLETTFRFGGSESSRRDFDIQDSALTLIYGGKACRFSIDGKEAGGNLPKAVNAGTEVIIEISPSKEARVTVGDTLILDQQPLNFDQCYVTFTSDSSSLKNRNNYSDLRISRFSVEFD
ncbi:MAG: hypothetical protein AAF546_07540 [Verrucomicrobiota bacterium]